MGLDNLKEQWKNRGMLRVLIYKLVSLATGRNKMSLKVRREPLDIELNNYREDMKGQFEHLKKKGLPIRISTL